MRLLLMLAGVLLPFGAWAAETLRIPGGHLAVTQPGTSTVLEVIRGGRRERLVLPPDPEVYARTLEGSSLVGAGAGPVLIVSSDYLSHPRKPGGMCGAGTETLLRVIALRPRPHQTFHQLVASCWLTIEPGAITWDRATSVLTIEREVFSQPASHTRVRYAVAPDGTTTQVASETLP